MAIGAKSARIEVKVLGAREIGQVFDALPKQVNKNKIWIKIINLIMCFNFFI